MTSGYSGTPLGKKLGIKENFKLLLYNNPTHYFDLFSDLPETIEIANSITPQSTDFIHIFCTSIEELKTVVINYKSALKKMDPYGLAGQKVHLT